MSNITVELSHEMVDKVLVEEMLNSREGLLDEFDRRRGGVYDMDPEEDRKQVREMILALEKVIDWYSVPGSVEFDELPE